MERLHIVIDRFLNVIALNQEFAELSDVAPGLHNERVSVLVVNIHFGLRTLAAPGLNLVKALDRRRAGLAQLLYLLVGIRLPIFQVQAKGVALFEGERVDIKGTPAIRNTR